MKTWIIVAVLGVIAITATIIFPQPSAAADKVTVSGSFFYRERIAPPPGSTARVVLQDVSRADAAAITLAQQNIDLSSASGPYDYALSVEGSLLEPSMTYAVRITIRSADGALLWTTDTLYQIKSQAINQRLSPIKLVRVGGAAAVAPPKDLLGHEWKVTAVDGKDTPKNAMSHIRFGADGTVSGKAGCNRLRGAYKRTGSTVSFGPLATTRRACVPMIQDFETLFLAVFIGDMTVAIEGDTLTLTNKDNRQILATRN